MSVRTYAIVTMAYWSFTVTDGALRMLVLLHFHDLGYSPVTLGFLFVLYELLGVVTNLAGGWMGARFGLHRTLHAGLGLQVTALFALSLQDPGWPEAASVVFVMVTQALSGVAKDLTKVSSKSAIKLVVNDADGSVNRSKLFGWVAALTGSKNALKGVGFFVGGALLSSIGFGAGLVAMACALSVVLLATLVLLQDNIGRSSVPTSPTSVLSRSSAINRLSAARFFLFGARDVWFVVALPVYLDDVLGWSFEGIGAFLAAWIIGYGMVQAAAPRLLGAGTAHDSRSAHRLAFALALVTASIATLVSADAAAEVAVVGGLVVFGAVFALNSSVHSYLILAFTERDDDVTTNVGFYYSANAAGRLVGTVASGVAYLAGGFSAALWTSTAFIAAAWVLSLGLPAIDGTDQQPTPPDPPRP